MRSGPFYSRFFHDQRRFLFLSSNIAASPIQARPPVYEDDVSGVNWQYAHLSAGKAECLGVRFCRKEKAELVGARLSKRASIAMMDQP